MELPSRYTEVVTMDKIKRFIDCYIPTETCNLRCHYCYITQERKFRAKLLQLTHSPEEISKALSLERLGGICLINMCAGGETLLSHELLPVVQALINEGHYISIVTNGTLTERFVEISSWPKTQLSHLLFKFSYHFLELKRLGWTERFFDNVQRMKKAGASVTVEITPSDELIPYIDEVKENCLKYSGAVCHVTVARDNVSKGIEVLSKLPYDEYKKTWGQFDSALFDFKSRIFYQKRKEYCYAGDWFFILNLETGSIFPCYRKSEIGNIYEDISKPLRYQAVGCNCSLAHCFNGHAMLALGVIPEIEAPTYAEERNRICADGTEWLQPEMKAFMSSKLYESNKEYNILKKIECNMREKLRQIAHHPLVRKPLRAIKRAVRFLK